MNTHFQYEMIPAGRWSRIKGTTPRGGDEDRPHLVPITEMGERLVTIEATGFAGRTGLCPGEITREDGSKVLAYRFIRLPLEEVPMLIAQLNGQVRGLLEAGRD